MIRFHSEMATIASCNKRQTYRSHHSIIQEIFRDRLDNKFSRGGARLENTEAIGGKRQLVVGDCNVRKVRLRQSIGGERNRRSFLPLTSPVFVTTKQ